MLNCVTSPTVAVAVNAELRSTVPAKILVRSIVAVVCAVNSTADDLCTVTVQANCDSVLKVAVASLSVWLSATMVNSLLRLTAATTVLAAVTVILNSAVKSATTNNIDSGCAVTVDTALVVVYCRYSPDHSGILRICVTPTPRSV